MVAISVGLAAGLIALGLITMVIAGVRSLVIGKQDFKKMGMMAVPFIIFAISYGVAGEVAKGAVMTATVMMALMVGAIVLTGLRGTFKF